MNDWEREAWTAILVERNEAVKRLAAVIALCDKADRHAKNISAISGARYRQLGVLGADEVRAAATGEQT